MIIKDCDGKELLKVTTIEELYFWAKDKNLEKAGLGLSIFDVDSGFDYCEEVFMEDISVGTFFIRGKEIDDFNMLWIDKH